jgi:hypothetical protein
MAVLETLITTAAGATAATVGVVVGGFVARRSQDRHWLRDRQLDAYVELLRHYARFSSELKRAHVARRHWDYDWGEWSAALTSASMVASPKVAAAIADFAHAIDTFLDRVAVDTVEQPLSLNEFEQASRAPAVAQLELVNAIRRSLGRRQGSLSEWLGGSLVRPEST